MKEQWLGGYPERTRRLYRAVLDEFERITCKPAEQASKADVLTYERAQQDKAPSTIRNRLSSLSSFFRYLTDQDARTDNPMRVVRMAKYKVDPLSTIKYLEPGQVAALMAACEDERSRALISVLLHGLRVSEAVGLDAGQLRDGALVAVLGKGAKYRTVPISQDGQAILAAYLAGRIDGPMFRARSGRRLSVRHAQTIVSTLSERAGKRVNPHRLRHTMATTLLRGGVGLAHVQDLLGHRSADTTRQYARLTATELRSAVDSVDLLASKTEATVPHLRVVEGGRR